MKKTTLILLPIIFLAFGCTQNSQKDTNNNEKQNNNAIVKNINDEENNNLDNFNDDILTQLNYLESLINNDLLPTNNDCLILANYNNLSRILSKEELKKALPEEKTFYYEKCQNSFAKIANIQDTIAEPELVNLREIVSNYTNATKKLALFALQDKYNATEIDNYDTDTKELLLKAREEIVKLRRIYYIK